MLRTSVLFTVLILSLLLGFCAVARADDPVPAKEEAAAPTDPMQIIGQWMMGEALKQFAGDSEPNDGALARWFDGGADVPFASLRDALRKGGWDAAKLQRWLMTNALGLAQEMGERMGPMARGFMQEHEFGTFGPNGSGEMNGNVWFERGFESPRGQGKGPRGKGNARQGGEPRAMGPGGWQGQGGQGPRWQPQGRDGRGMGPGGMRGPRAMWRAQRFAGPQGMGPRGMGPQGRDPRGGEQGSCPYCGGEDGHEPHAHPPGGNGRDGGAHGQRRSQGAPWQGRGFGLGPAQGAGPALGESAPQAVREWLRAWLSTPPSRGAALGAGEPPVRARVLRINGEEIDEEVIIERRPPVAPRAPEPPKAPKQLMPLKEPMPAPGAK